jgi:sulfur carrier protein
MTLISAPPPHAGQVRFVREASAFCAVFAFSATGFPPFVSFSKEYRQIVSVEFRVWDRRHSCQGFLSLQTCRGRFPPVQVRLLPQNKVVTFSEDLRVTVLLRKLSLLPQTVMVIRGDRLLTEDEIVRAEDEIEIRSVISGGV